MTSNQDQSKSDSRRVKKKPSWRRVYEAIRKLFRSTPIATAVAATIFVFLLIFLYGLFGLVGVLTQSLTTTVTAATESLSFSLGEGTESSWVLPPGNFLVNSELPDPSKCTPTPRENEYVPQEYICAISKNLRLVVEGAAKITHSVTPNGYWSIAVVGSNDPNFVIRLLVDNDVEFARYEQELRFGTNLGDLGDRKDQDQASEELAKKLESIRIAVIAATAEVGSHVRHATGVSGKLSDFWQPALLSGNVATYSLNRPEKGKFQILSERLDSGDIIGMYTEENIFGQESDDTIWGVATIEEQTVLLSDTTEVTQYVIYTVLHTTHRALSVRRFGAGEGHEIRASRWTIISRWPNGQEAWVAFISAILVMTFVLQLADSLKRKPLKSKKKGKKHRKRKGD